MRARTAKRVPLRLGRVFAGLRRPNGHAWISRCASGSRASRRPLDSAAGLHVEPELLQGRLRVPRLRRLHPAHVVARAADALRRMNLDADPSAHGSRSVSARPSRARRRLRPGVTSLRSPSTLVVAQERGEAMHRLGPLAVGGASETRSPRRALLVPRPRRLTRRGRRHLRTRTHHVPAAFSADLLSRPENTRARLLGCTSPHEHRNEATSSARDLRARVSLLPARARRRRSRRSRRSELCSTPRSLGVRARAVRRA
jgi:hypothetical protein